jgi:hypothetical protein
MRMRALAVGVLTLSFAAGCAQPKVVEEAAEKAELSAEDKALVLDQAPSDIAHPLYVDFNGKAELLGYELEPATLAAPGSKLSLKLYWRASGPIGDGYLLFTELVTPDGKRFDVEGGGPVRKGALVPAHWERSKVYVDALEVSVPSELEASRFSIVVGFKTQPVAPEEPTEAAEADAKPAAKADKKDEKPATFGAVFLSVVSGPADGKHGGVVATLETGVTAARAKRAATKDDARRRLPSGKAPASAKPRVAPAQ